MKTMEKAIEAARSGDLETLKTLSTEADFELHFRIAEPGNFQGSTLLHHAAKRNQAQVVEYLLAAGLDPNAGDCSWYRTPLAWAADGGSAEAARILLRHGADALADIGQGFVALHACACGGRTNGKENPEGYRETCRLLLAAGTDIRHARNAQQLTPLQMAEKQGNRAVADLLKELGG